MKKDKEKQKDEKPRETTVEFLASLAGVLVTGLFIITFVLQAFEIPSSSMVKTLLIGDHVFVNRVQFSPRTSWVGPLLPYSRPKRGDIVVFLSMDPRTPGLYIVKRIIGVPGDKIHLPPTDEGNVIDEWKLTMGSHIENGDIVVPPDSYFGMGDNRDVSLDSRYWGFIAKDHIIGRPMFIYWSFETPEDQYQQTEISQRLSFMAHVVLHFFDETRWKRTLKAVR